MAVLSAQAPQPFVEAINITKTFGGVKALDEVSLTVFSGEVLCLAGENGCGKSTLIKVISGVHSVDSGELRIRGKRVTDLTPHEAMEAGIQVIYQDFSLFPNFTVAENISLTASVTTGRFTYNKKHAHSVAAEICERLGIALPLDQDVSTLSVADRQLTAICRALVADAQLLIMDEPTTALTQREVERLFVVVERLREQGVALIFVSHKLDEVMQIAQRIVIMRSGKNIIDRLATEIDARQISAYMTGREIDDTRRVSELDDERPVLELRDVCVDGMLDHITFSVKQGEILGVTGLLGSGRSEIAEAIFGILPITSGTIRVAGEEVSIRRITDAINAGIGYVPEDRLTQGLFLDKSIADNVIASSLDLHTSRVHMLKNAMIRQTIQRYFDELRIKAPHTQAPVRSLSGGNAQRVVLAKWLARGPKVLLLNGPTVGVDVGSKSEILDILAEQAQHGMGIIIISDDAPELVRACHRVLIIKDGRIADMLEGDDITVERIRAEVSV